jgi:hypothetical protein
MFGDDGLLFTYQPFRSDGIITKLHANVANIYTDITIDRQQ